jgi:hypothetical protein
MLFGVDFYGKILGYFLTIIGSALVGAIVGFILGAWIF